MIRTLLVDDEEDSRRYLCGLLGDYTPDVRVVGQAADKDQARALLTADPPDLVFLDVEMPGGSGVDLLREMGTWPFEVIFTTGFARYAVQAIRFSALDYLLKPVQPDELVAALARFRDRHPSSPDRSEVQQQFIRNAGHADERAMKLTLGHGGRHYFIDPSDITHCLADRNYTELHLQDGRRFISARTLKEFEDMLRTAGFIRVHRSAIVNMAAVAHVEEEHVVLHGGHRVELSRRRRTEVRLLLAGN